tara:strand:+ start:302 stop:625 length:324 start_codon:yes stop_codon:yes gene_type:complete
MELILIILVSYGISNIVVFGSIFESLRDYAMSFNPNFLGKLLTCMMCTPFWVGFFISLGSILSGYTQFSPFYNGGLENIYLTIFLDSCLLSGTTWLIHTIQERLEVE